VQGLLVRLAGIARSVTPRRPAERHSAQRRARRRHYPISAVLVVGCLLLAAAVPAKTVRGTNGPDVLRGTSRADSLYGFGGPDRIFGLRGDDLVVGGPGADVLVGGPGNDRLVARDGVADVLRCGPGLDTAVVDSRDRVSKDCEKVQRPSPSGATFVLAGAGDIADGGSGDVQTARLLDRIKPDVVFTTGDNAYPDGKLSDFQRYYDPTWGRYKDVTRPSPGNHDHHTSGAAGYFAYFGPQAPAAYYSYDLGSWHVISLDTELPVEPGSPQYEWLRKDLAASRATCTLAYWHKPRFTAGQYDDQTFTRPLWELLYAARAELVLNGHDHDYQRYTRLDPAGHADPSRGIREMVVGTGGAGLYRLRPDVRREAGYDKGYGVLQLTLRPKSYDWRFVPVSGSYTDPGSGACS